LGFARRLAVWFGGVIAGLAAAGCAAGAPVVFSLDQCADEYVLALAPRADIVGLSYRADDADSYLREQARGLPLRRASLESVLATRPDIVVRYWGGDELMARRLAERGIKVVKIDDADDFDGVRANVRRVASALGRPQAGEALIAHMDAELKAARGAWRSRRALYLTPSGFTAGHDTLVGAMMAAAGMVDAAPSASFAPVSLERLTLDPPNGLVLGFFDKDSMQTQNWSMGRRGALKLIASGRTLAVLPASVLGCPGWFAADGVRDLARAAQTHARP
jgi:iron complex transport system substrate-binding protein